MFVLRVEESKTFFLFLKTIWRKKNRRILPLSTELTALFRLKSEASFAAKNWFPIGELERERESRREERGRAERARSIMGAIWFRAMASVRLFGPSERERESERKSLLSMVGRVCSPLISLGLNGD